MLRVWAVIIALATVVLFNFATYIADAVGDQRITRADVCSYAAIGVGALLIVFAVSQVWWSQMGFRVGPEEVILRQGVISTKLRSARYDRIQAVDVVEPLAARICGLAAVRVEAAGGANSAIEIGFLKRADVEDVREELLRRIAVTTGDMGLSNDHHHYVVPPIPIARSLIGAFLRLTTLFTLVWSFVPALTSVTFAVIMPILIGFIPQIWRQIDQSWRYQAFLIDDVVHLSYGLANRRKQSVPLDRIHAVGLSQPIFWRIFGWWTVSVNIAGYGRESSKVSGTSRLLPVGSYQQALELLSAIGPFTVEELHRTASPDFWQFRSPRRAALPSPIDAGRQAVSLLPTPSGTVALTRHGRFSRKLEFIETSHIQELTYRRGPIQKALKLAHVRFNLVPGPVKMKARDLDDCDAWALVDKLRARQTPDANPS
nr:PH domain-containing protein [Corynebacterium aquatimens]